MLTCTRLRLANARHAHTTHPSGGSANNCPEPCPSPISGEPTAASLSLQCHALHVAELRHSQLSDVSQTLSPMQSTPDPHFPPWVAQHGMAPKRADSTRCAGTSTRNTARIATFTRDRRHYVDTDCEIHRLSGPFQPRPAARHPAEDPEALPMTPPCWPIV